MFHFKHLIVYKTFSECPKESTKYNDCTNEDHNYYNITYYTTLQIQINNTNCKQADKLSMKLLDIYEAVQIGSTFTSCSIAYS